jgi:hypothetical protein
MNGFSGVASAPFVWIRVSLVFNTAQGNCKKSRTNRKTALIESQRPTTEQDMSRTSYKKLMLLYPKTA